MKPILHSLSVCAGCGSSGDDFGSVNVEAFEVTGELYCEDCAEEAIRPRKHGGRALTSRTHIQGDRAASRDEGKLRDEQNLPQSPDELRVAVERVESFLSGEGCCFHSDLRTLLEALREARDEADHLSDRLVEAADHPWPKWAEAILKKMVEYGAADTHDDEIDLAEVFEEWADGYAAEEEAARQRIERERDEALREVERLKEAATEARDLLLERIQGSPARSAGHNARLVLEAALTPSPAKGGDQ